MLDNPINLRLIYEKLKHYILPLLAKLKLKANLSPSADGCCNLLINFLKEIIIYVQAKKIV